MKKSLAILLLLCIGAAADVCRLSALISETASLPILDIVFELEDNAVIYAESVSIDFQDGINPDALQKPPSDLKEYTGKALFRFAMPQKPCTFSVSYQACGGDICYMPVTKQFRFDGQRTVSPLAAAEEHEDASVSLDDFTVVATASGYQSADAFLKLCDKAENGAASDSNILETAFRRFGFVFALLLLLPLGALLNCTPCVLPLIPINLAIIGATGDDRSKILRRSCIYALGMLLAYGSLGVVTVLTGSLFGSINSSPVFNFAIAALFAALALSLFDVFTIDLSRWRGGGRVTSAAGVFIMGGVTAILSSACVAPVLIWALVLATSLYSQGMPHALLLPFFLGLGMALPWPLIALGIARLPAPGTWMVKIRQAFGIIVAAFAIYYIIIGIRLANAGATSREGWNASSAEALSEARSGSKPLLIEFTGKSCKACETMDRTTFKNKKVLSRLQDFAKLEVNIDDKTAESMELASRFKIIGAPSFVFLRPNSEK